MLVSNSFSILMVINVCACIQHLQNLPSHFSPQKTTGGMVTKFYMSISESLMAVWSWIIFSDTDTQNVRYLAAVFIHFFPPKVKRTNAKKSDFGFKQLQISFLSWSYVPGCSFLKRKRNAVFK